MGFRLVNYALKSQEYIIVRHRDMLDFCTFSPISSLYISGQCYSKIPITSDTSLSSAFPILPHSWPKGKILLEAVNHYNFRHKKPNSMMQYCPKLNIKILRSLANMEIVGIILFCVNVAWRHMLRRVYLSVEVVLGFSTILF